MSNPTLREPLQITLTLTEDALLIFFAIRGRKVARMAGERNHCLGSEFAYDLPAIKAIES